MAVAMAEQLVAMADEDEHEDWKRCQGKEAEDWNKAAAEERQAVAMNEEAEQEDMQRRQGQEEVVDWAGSLVGMTLDEAAQEMKEKEKEQEEECLRGGGML